METPTAAGTPTTSTASTSAPSANPTTSTAPSNPSSDPQMAAVEALRERLGLAKPKPAAAATEAAASSSTSTTTPASSASAPAPGASAEENALRALAEEQLRQTRERRKLDEERKTDAETRKAERDKAATFDRLKKAIAAGNRVGVLRILHDDSLPDGALGEWAQEIAVAMSGQAPTLGPEDVERLVERKVAEKEQAAKDAAKKAADEAAAVRTEANQRYMTALDGAIKAEPKRWPGLARFGANAGQVMAAVEESFRASGGTGVLPVFDVLNKLEADLKAGFEAAYGPQPSAQSTAAPPGAPQTAATATVTAPSAPAKPRTPQEADDEARREILRKVHEIQRAQKAR